LSILILQEIPICYKRAVIIGALKILVVGKLRNRSSANCLISRKFLKKDVFWTQRIFWGGEQQNPYFKFLTLVAWKTNNNNIITLLFSRIYLF